MVELVDIHYCQLTPENHYPHVWGYICFEGHDHMVWCSGANDGR